MTTSSETRLKIIGLAGTNGAGKGVLADLIKGKGYFYVSLSSLFRDELRRRGLPIIRENTAKISAEWRRDYGMDTLVTHAYEKFEQQSGYKGLVVESLRHPAEADKVHALGGQVIWVDADPKIRYARIQANADSRGRPGEDRVSFEEWLADEEREMHPEGDGATLNGSAVKERADMTIFNNGDDIEAFKAAAAKSLNLS